MIIVIIVLMILSALTGCYATMNCFTIVDDWMYDWPFDYRRAIVALTATLLAMILGVSAWQLTMSIENESTNSELECHDQCMINPAGSTSDTDEG